jgi:transcriptional regulator with XRE-family HTH domain
VKTAQGNPPVKPAQEAPLVKAAQVRMARAGLDWSLEDLAQAAGVPRNTIANFERGIYEGEPTILQKMRRALEKAGIEFTDGDRLGVRLKAKRR